MKKLKHNEKPKGQKKHLSFKTQKIIVTSVLVALLIGISIYIAPQYNRMARAVDRAESITLSSLLVRSIEGIHRPAPVDPTTGDVYFPEAKLKIPRNVSMPELLYSYSSGDATLPEEISITSEATSRHATNRVVAAESVDEVLAAVPEAQSCRRGLLLTYDEQDSSAEKELLITKILENGRTLYIYSEPACSSIKVELLDVFSSIESY